MHVRSLRALLSGNINLLGTNSPSTQSLVTPAYARGVPGEQLAPLPKLIYVELADYCNLSCTFCQRSTYVDSVGRGGFIDFDKATADPAHPDTFLPAYDHGDHLHPSDPGYKAMGDAIDLSLFKSGSATSSSR